MPSNSLPARPTGASSRSLWAGGEPLLHPDIAAMLRLAREEYGIIPNYTTCGKYFNQSNIAATRAYCGAIAVSWDPYRDDLSIQDLSKLGSCLKSEGIRCNIHYVVSEQTLGQAIAILRGECDEHLRPFNAVIFLTYKPLGRADSTGVIKSPDALKSYLGLMRLLFRLYRREPGGDALFFLQ